MADILYQPPEQMVHESDMKTNAHSMMDCDTEVSHV
jgi:hypothetical protein